MGRIKDLNSALPTENDAFVFDGANGTKRLSYAEFKQKLQDDGFGSGSSEAVVLTQAEYDALPDEVKDSDTIFFISDAPFENSNVVTLTRAQYDALSDATKMDGRFYYITDEEEVAKSLVVQNNVNSTETVPSSAVVYGLKSDSDNQISELNDSLTYKDGGAVFALNTDLSIPSDATVLMVRVLITGDSIGWTFPLLRSWLTSEIRTYSVGGTGSTTSAYWGADIQATSSAIRLTRVTKNGTAATNFQLALWYR